MLVLCSECTHVGTSVRLVCQIASERPPTLPLRFWYAFFVAGEAITFYTEDDSWQLRSIVNVMRTAGCEVPDWMLHLKKERRKGHNKAGKKASTVEQNQGQVPGDKQ